MYFFVGQSPHSAFRLDKLLKQLQQMDSSITALNSTICYIINSPSLSSEDIQQLEAWLQSKITKAADYMSSVYHYLDYQRSKMDEGFNFTLNDREVDDDFEIEGGHGTDLFISKAYYTNGEALSDDEIDALIDKYPAGILIILPVIKKGLILLPL